MGVERKKVVLRVGQKRITENHLQYTASIQEDDQKPDEIPYTKTVEELQKREEKLISLGWKLESRETINNQTTLVFTRSKSNLPQLFD